MMKTITACLLSTALGAALITGASADDRPRVNTSPRRHPHINAAQELSKQAFERVTAAQQANEWDLQGHAAKAKELLEQANAELKLAAEASNANAHP